MNIVKVVGLAGLLAAGVVVAHPQLDKNGDGVVTLDEFESGRIAVLEQRFAALDTDHDGQLSQAELQAGRERVRWHHATGARIDKDGDGAWSFAELQAVRPELTVEDFNKRDKNGDGLITADERPHRHRGARPVAESVTE